MNDHRDLLACLTGPDWPDPALRRHVADAAIAAQLAPPTDAEWLAKCERVRAAQAQIKNPDFSCESTGVRALRR